MSYQNILLPELHIEEGVRKFPYRDSKGILTIGVGRNLEAVGLHDTEIDFMLNNDVADAEATARALVPAFDQLSENRQAVIVDMAFNLGLTRLRGFVLMLAAVNRGDFDAAADEMLHSKWATDVGDRAQRLAVTMRTG